MIMHYRYYNTVLCNTERCSMLDCCVLCSSPFARYWQTDKGIIAIVFSTCSCVCCVPNTFVVCSNATTDRTILG